jgi:cell division protease FtsH
LGVTQFLPEEDQLSVSESQLLAQLAVLLGGRAAERLIYHDLTSGASNDLDRVTRIARRMVTQWGMSDRVGPVSFRTSEEHPFLGREMAEVRDHSEHTAQVIDEEVARICREADERALRVLEENRDELERLTEALIEREVISVREIEELIGKRTGAPAETPVEAVAASMNQPESEVP